MTNAQGLLLGLLIGALMVSVPFVRFLLYVVRHRRAMAELDEINRHTALASKALGANREAYEFHMTQAVRKLEEFQMKYDQRSPEGR